MYDVARSLSPSHLCARAPTSRTGNCATSLPTDDDGKEPPLDQLPATSASSPSLTTTDGTANSSASDHAAATGHARDAPQGAPCLEDVFEGGVRLTFAWADTYPDSRQLEPLAALAARSVGLPHVLLAGVGAWFAHGAPTLGVETTRTRYAAAVARLWADLEAVFDASAHFEGACGGLTQRTRDSSHCSPCTLLTDGAARNCVWSQARMRARSRDATA
jgi:hypothetical protein